MDNKIYIVFCLFFLISCSKIDANLIPANLKDYLDINSSFQLDEVIACAASDLENNAISYIFYLPLLNASEIKYFETDGTNLNEKNFSLYAPRELKKEDVFNGYLERFVRNDTKEAWSIVTFKIGGKLHVSNPIRLKHHSKPTEWSSNVLIDFNQPTSPIFSWNDGLVKENAIYFSVVTAENNDLLSGIYTYDKWFQYYQLGNVVLNITRETPPSLETGKLYKYVMMGVSLDNWVNLVIQKKFSIQ